MYYLQHELLCCIRYTNSSRRQEFVYLIQHEHECCKWLVKCLDENIRILQQFNKNDGYLKFREKSELKVYVNQHDLVSDIQTPSCPRFICHELLMSSTSEDEYYDGIMD